MLKSNSAVTARSKAVLEVKLSCNSQVKGSVGVKLGCNNQVKGSA